MRKKLVVSIGIISLATLGGLLTSKVAGGSGVEPPLAPSPPMSFAEQASLPVSDENGPMVCGGQTVTVGYVREHVLKVETVPPPPEPAGSASPSSDPARYPPDNLPGQQTAASSYVFRCVDDEVVAIPAP